MFPELPLKRDLLTYKSITIKVNTMPKYNKINKLKYRLNKPKYRLKKCELCNKKFYGFYKRCAKLYCYEVYYPTYPKV